MNDYDKKKNWKILLLLFAIAIGVASLFYTNTLVKKLAAEEEKNIRRWANAIKLSGQIPILDEENQELDHFLNEVSSHVYDILTENEHVPVILTDTNNQIISFKNLDSSRIEKEFEFMKEEKSPIEIEFYQGQKNYVYYKDSYLLTQLKYYPYVQLSLITLFILVSYVAFSASRRSEQNQVWVGMSKETAHQLGTPISSLMAWLDVLKAQNENQENNEIFIEFEKDIKRLELITERFSKIGSAPVLKPENIKDVFLNAINYLKTRTSSRVVYNLECKDDIYAPINIPLFDWVIENLSKNAIDAMDGQGYLTFKIKTAGKKIIIDMSDTGKGIPKSKFATVFKPGYTTKKRGWGLGLSLVKRIIDIYHKGQIFVHHSELGKGTTFRIILKTTNAQDSSD